MYSKMIIFIRLKCTHAKQVATGFRSLFFSVDSLDNYNSSPAITQLPTAYSSTNSEYRHSGSQRPEGATYLIHPKAQHS